jgi:hypothetical protein
MSDQPLTYEERWTLQAKAWEEGHRAGIRYAKSAWWRIPKPVNPYLNKDQT